MYGALVIINTKGNGRMAKEMGKASTHANRAADMKDNGRMDY